MNEKIELIRTNGESIQADLICFFENTLNNKRFIYYTLNEMVGSGPSATIKVYVGKTKQNNINLDTPISEEEWEVLKGLMGEILKSTSNANVKYLSINELLDKTLVSEKVIAMPTSYDYINKHKNVYLEALASTSPATIITPNENNVTNEQNVTNTIPVEPTPVESTPIVIEPVTPTVVEPTSINTTISQAATEPTPIAETPISQNSNISASVTTVVQNDSSNLKPINIEEIETKYTEMAETLNKLKEQEIEAAKRYNATLELNAMHNEQHAEYIANEQNKNVASTAVESTPIEPAVAPIHTEPAPVEPTPIAPGTPVSPTNIETNWFDMPNQG